MYRLQTYVTYLNTTIKNTADYDACYVSKIWWSGSILQFRQNITKVGSKSWLLTCSSNITLRLLSYTGSALKRELYFCNSYLSLLYFWLQYFPFLLFFQVEKELKKEKGMEIKWGQPSLANLAIFKLISMTPKELMKNIKNAYIICTTKLTPNLLQVAMLLLLVFSLSSWT